MLEESTPSGHPPKLGVGDEMVLAAVLLPRASGARRVRDGKVQPGVVSAKLNWVKTTPGFHSINSLTSEKLTDMGNSATFYSVLVEVELATPTPSSKQAR